MRSAGSPLLATSFAFASLACAPTAAAEPRHPEEPPLVRGDLATDADISRALREHYTKFEYRIRMRDGVRLFTEAFVPKDATRAYPILLMRTPYAVAPYGVDNFPKTALFRVAPSSHFVRAGYIIVRQDVRGRMMSEGTFVDVRPHAAKPGEIDESTDAFDTIDWLVKNVPANNGRVGIWGVSYPGFYAAQAAVDAHPALKAVSPQAPVTDWFLGDDFHHNGAFFFADAFDFYANFGKPRPEPTRKASWDRPARTDVYDFFLGMGPLANVNAKHFKGQIRFWNDFVAHSTRDAFWKARDPRPFYKKVKPAVMTVGGWFDAEDLFGALETYRAFEKQSPGAENTLVMGPWRHGGWGRTEGDHLGDVSFGQKTSLFYRERIEFPFFERHLRGKAGKPLAEAWAFETGTNQWQSYPSWPPPGAKSQTLFFHAKGKLAATASGLETGDQAFDAFVSDPNRPVPYRSKLSSEIDGEYMIDDQRFAARRPDVLVYSMGELGADVTLGGPIEASLWVTTTGTDADFVVKLVDVYPDDHADPEPNPTGVRMGGYQQLVRAEVMRAKFRASFEKPEPLEPGKPTLVRFALQDVSHTFRTGHRIMVQVQSSWFPLVDRNPQSFVDIFRATETDFRVATHRVLRSGEKPSSLSVTVARGALP